MKMNTIWAIVAATLIIIGGWWYWTNSHAAVPAGTVATTTTATTDTTLSLGTLSLAYPSSQFGLATSPDQITAKAYIPPCDSSFDDCFYYIGTAYAGTNFESAGLRVKTRTDLKTQAVCLTTPPSGYASMKPSVATSTDYAVSTFSPMGDAGAGHYASGSLYRLSYAGTCYEFETRIGATQFANYPTGSIKEFTPANQDAVTAMLMAILKSITVSSGAKPF